MKGVMAFFRGIGFKTIRPAIYAWFFNFFFALFIYFGYYRLFSEAAGKTKIAADIVGEIGIFTFLVDLSRSSSGNLSLLWSLALMGALIFLLVSIFVAGGIYSVLIGDERTTFSNLIASSVENFFNMIKISLINILNWIVASIIPVILLVLFVSSKALVQNETTLQIFSYVWLGITALIFTFSTAIYDFSRIFRLKEDRGTFYAFKQAILFTFSNKLKILAIFLMYGISLVILFLIYAIFSHFLENLLYALFIFIIYQGFIMARYFLKVTVMRAEIKLTENNGA